MLNADNIYFDCIKGVLFSGKCTYVLRDTRYHSASKIQPACFYWACTDKNHEKNTGIFSKFSKNENIVVKMGELFTNFYKNVLILRKFGKNSRHFHQILPWFLWVFSEKSNTRTWCPNFFNFHVSEKRPLLLWKSIPLNGSKILIFNGATSLFPRHQN